MFSDFLQRVLPMAILVLAVVAVPAMILRPEGLARMHSLRDELAQVRSENTELRRDVVRLRAEVDELRTNPLAVERIARNQLGLVRKSEIVFQFGSK